MTSQKNKKLYVRVILAAVLAIAVMRLLGLVASAFGAHLLSPDGMSGQTTRIGDLVGGLVENLGSTLGVSQVAAWSLFGIVTVTSICEAIFAMFAFAMKNWARKALVTVFIVKVAGLTLLILTASGLAGIRSLRIEDMIFDVVIVFFLASRYVGSVFAPETALVGTGTGGSLPE